MAETAMQELPAAQGDRERESFTLDGQGRPAQRVVDLKSADSLELLREIARDMRAVRLGIEAILGEEIPDVR